MIHTNWKTAMTCKNAVILNILDPFEGEKERKVNKYVLFPLSPENGVLVAQDGTGYLYDWIYSEHKPLSVSQVEIAVRNFPKSTQPNLTFQIPSSIEDSDTLNALVIALGELREKNPNVRRAARALFRFVDPVSSHYVRDAERDTDRFVLYAQFPKTIFIEIAYKYDDILEVFYNVFEANGLKLRISAADVG